MRLTAVSIIPQCTHTFERMGLGKLGKKKVMGMKEWSRSRYASAYFPCHTSLNSGPSRHLVDVSVKSYVCTVVCTPGAQPGWDKQMSLATRVSRGCAT